MNVCLKQIGQSVVFGLFNAGHWKHSIQISGKASLSFSDQAFERNPNWTL